MAPDKRPHHRPKADPYPPPPWMNSSEITLAKEPYYHGLLPREDMKALLPQLGDFAVRMSEPQAGKPRQFILSVLADPPGENAIRHIVIKKFENNTYMVESPNPCSFQSIQELINHYVRTQESVVNTGNPAVLKNGSVRQQWELRHKDITCTKKLGEGAFGEVHLGVYRCKRKGDIKCAIKLAKLEQMTKEQIKEFLNEARLMRQFNHPNVVRIYGSAALMEPLMLCMELASNGALDSYLQKNNVSVQQKTEMVVQASWGLEYLHSKPILHRDIAARNCLYGDGKVKISDFGMSREGTFYKMSAGRRVPIRWLAPETIRQQTFSTKTDAYSYGIMCWEIFHNGKEPYPGMSPGDCGKQVLQGYRMLFEADTPAEIARMITEKVWPDDADSRYSMDQISRELERITGIQRPDFTEHASDANSLDTGGKPHATPSGEDDEDENQGKSKNPRRHKAGSKSRAHHGGNKDDDDDDDQQNQSKNPRRHKKGQAPRPGDDDDDDDDPQSNLSKNPRRHKKRDDQHKSQQRTERAKKKKNKQHKKE